jgi:precorrin-3B methylase
MKLRIVALPFMLLILAYSCNAQSTPKKVTLTWGAPVVQTGITVTGYKIYRGTTAGGEGTIAFATPTGTSTTYVDNAVNPGTTYFYKVTAVGSCDPAVFDCSTFIAESVPSNEASSGKVPFPTAPAIGAPTAATAVVN